MLGCLMQREEMEATIQSFAGFQIALSEKNEH
jgi:hypothetical protein